MPTQVNYKSNDCNAREIEVYTGIPFRKTLGLHNPAKVQMAILKEFQVQAGISVLRMNFPETVVHVVMALI
jgi:hypothetical protein